MEKEVRELLKTFLPSHEVTYIGSEEQNILGLRFSNAGVAVKLDDGLEFFGSSSSEVEDPLHYAAFECLERYVLLKQSQIASTKSFRMAISNGVAIHSNEAQAKESALFELIERNEILKSWYFNTPIAEVDFTRLKIQSPDFYREYTLRVIEFSTLKGFSVIGIFAFPKNGANLVYGFGAERTQGKALMKAKKEFITRLGFLWGETPSEEEQEQASPLFHQEFYMKPENHIHIQEWLKPSTLKTPCENYCADGVEYVEFTPSEWAKSFWVIKATSKDTLPLFFGIPPRDLFTFTHRCDIPHPVV